jgi:hypothetical protein
MRQLPLQALALSLALIGFGPTVGAQTAEAQTVGAQSAQGAPTGVQNRAQTCGNGAGICRQTGKQAGKQAGKQTDKQTGKQTGKQAGKQAGAPGSADKGRKAELRKQAATSSADHGPQIGESARGGQEFKRGANSRFGSAPEGQSYRVVDKHLVLVDKKNLKVVKVLGLLDELVN